MVSRAVFSFEVHIPYSTKLLEEKPKLLKIIKKSIMAAQKYKKEIWLQAVLKGF